jgi:hypothetical protein
VLFRLSFFQLVALVHLHNINIECQSHTEITCQAHRHRPEAQNDHAGQSRALAMNSSTLEPSHQLFVFFWIVMFNQFYLQAILFLLAMFNQCFFSIVILVQYWTVKFLRSNSTLQELGNHKSLWKVNYLYL